MAKRGRKPGGHNYEQTFYTVYDNRTDKRLITAGTIPECCKLMGIKEASFYSAKSRCESGSNGRWHISAEKPHVIRSPLGNHLVCLMQKRGLNIRELSEKSGVSKQCIGRYLNDNIDARAYTLCALADALGVTMDELWRGNEI